MIRYKLLAGLHTMEASLECCGSLEILSPESIKIVAIFSDGYLPKIQYDIPEGLALQTHGCKWVPESLHPWIPDLVRPLSPINLEDYWKTLDGRASQSLKGNESFYRYAFLAHLPPVLHGLRDHLDLLGLLHVLAVITDTPIPEDELELLEDHTVKDICRNLNQLTTQQLLTPQHAMMKGAPTPKAALGYQIHEIIRQTIQINSEANAYLGIDTIPALDILRYLDTPLETLDDDLGIKSVARKMSQLLQSIRPEWETADPGTHGTLRDLITTFQKLFEECPTSSVNNIFKPPTADSFDSELAALGTPSFDEEPMGERDKTLFCQLQLLKTVSTIKSRDQQRLYWQILAKSPSRFQPGAQALVGLFGYEQLSLLTVQKAVALKCQIDERPPREVSRLLVSTDVDPKVDYLPSYHAWLKPCIALLGPPHIIELLDVDELSGQTLLKTLERLYSALSPDFNCGLPLEKEQSGLIWEILESDRSPIPQTVQKLKAKIPSEEERHALTLAEACLLYQDRLR